MADNGTELLVASAALADHPMVVLPLIFYNRVQHLVGGVDRLVCRPSPGPVTDTIRMQGVTHPCSVSNSHI
jgi:hypothetical protein